ncbi:hypothetical protein L1D59_17150 [Pseudoalteromonas piscicida]|uniref:hypothetical protein n=1 Tax=Pseudoalteromonas piscicida TaxID=43662 RepID=UPI001EFD2B1A|nr:hypothetical protein [Pseudoalteromonas piscicida]MCG9770322.1 hypothetical protein [Pseudoalteromonas piscicida]
MKKVVFTAVTSVLLFGNAFAQDTKVEAAHIASPNQYQLLLENEEVTVLKMTLKPGTGINTMLRLFTSKKVARRR